MVAVAHDEFANMSREEYQALGKDTHVLYDIKHVLPADRVDGRL